VLRIAAVVAVLGALVMASEAGATRLIRVHIDSPLLGAHCDTLVSTDPYDTGATTDLPDQLDCGTAGVRCEATVVAPFFRHRACIVDTSLATARCGDDYAYWTGELTERCVFEISAGGIGANADCWRFSRYPVQSGPFTVINDQRCTAVVVAPMATAGGDCRSRQTSNQYVSTDKRYCVAGPLTASCDETTSSYTYPPTHRFCFIAAGTDSAGVCVRRYDDDVPQVTFVPPVSCKP
jgi:hypothetical protein